MHSFALVAALTACAAAMDLPRTQPAEQGQHCCYVYDSELQMSDELCLEYGSRQATFALDTPIVDGYIRCGVRVDATVCSGEVIYGPVDGKSGLSYACKSTSAAVERGSQVGAGQAFRLNLRDRITTVFLDLHPWVATGAKYLSLSAAEKLDILWDKIEEDDTPGEPSLDFFFTDMKGVFDDAGDELQCRHKTAHQLGNVGKVRWLDLEGHNYTGIFNGGSDTGLARLSAQVSENPTGSPAGPVNTHFNPSIALKFLRDGVDSGNIMANRGGGGQLSFNFFEQSLTSNLFDAEVEVEARADGEAMLRHSRPETGFVVTVGHSNFAQYNNDGTQVEDPVFPFSIRYEPQGNIEFPDNGEESFQVQLKRIEKNSILYAVYARNGPESDEEKIAYIISDSQLVTSNWGDTKLFFRHQRTDDDLRYRPEWISHYGYFPNDIENMLGFSEGTVPKTVHPYQQKTRSSCPFSWMFE